MHRPMTEKKTASIAPWIHFIAGGISGTCGAVVTCPLEVVKTRLQSSLHSSTVLSHNPFVNVYSTLGYLYRVEGFSSWWRGLGASVLGVMPARAIYFSSYEFGKKKWGRFFGDEASMVHVMSAVTAGLLTSTFTNPIWVVKTRLQISNKETYKNSFDCLKTIMRVEGMSGLFRGISASYIGVSEGVIHWVLYEKMKQKIQTGESRGILMDSVTYVGTAGTAKLIAACTTYPHEVLRTRLREETRMNGVLKYRTLGQSARLIIREEGFGALYGGLSTHLIRVVPNTAIVFLCYEMVVKMLDSATKNKISLHQL